VNELISVVHLAIETFVKYGFNLQQWVTNSKVLRENLKEDSYECSEGEAKMLGVIFNTDDDDIKTRRPNLSENACTKRQVLSTLQTNFDPFGMNLPIFNRAKLFLHSLQCGQALNWDTHLNSQIIKDWRNIAKQVNKGPESKIPRNIGSRDAEYELAVYCDASEDLIGCVIYMNVKGSNSSSFVLAAIRW
jgi:hypothetical protein